MISKNLLVLILCIPLAYSTQSHRNVKFFNIKRFREFGREQANEKLTSSLRAPNISNTVAPISNTKNPAIFGGFEASQEVANFVAVILIVKKTGRSLCTGAVISRTKIITNAHCFFKKKSLLVSVEKVYVGVGLQDRTIMDVNNAYSAKYVHIFASYNRRQRAGDIAVVTLNYRLPASQNIAKYSKRNLQAEQLVQIAGYGTTEHTDGSPSYILQESTLSFLGISVCSARANIKRNYASSKRCFVSPRSFSPATSGCSGDSGGPIFYIHRNGRMYIYALHTYRNGRCGRKETINVGMKLKFFGKYIDGILSDYLSGWDEVFPDNNSNFDSA